MTRPSLIPYIRARYVRWLLRVGSMLLALAAWQWLAYRLDSILFPSFTATAGALATLVFQPAFWQALWVSHQALLVGFGLALLTGTALGLFMGRVPLAEKIIDPYLNILLALPMTALIPIIVLAIGLGLPARALVVFLFSVVVIVVNTRTGLRTVEPVWIEMAHAFGAGEWQLWRTILIPGALPALMTGFYLGLGRALTGMIAVELLLVAVGIGRMILDFQGTFEAASLYATIMLVVTEAVILLSGLKWLERRAAPWARQVSVE